MSFQEYVARASKTDIDKRVLDNFLASYKKDRSIQCANGSAPSTKSGFYSNSYLLDGKYALDGEFAARRLSYAQYLLEFPQGVHTIPFPKGPPTYEN